MAPVSLSNALYGGCPRFKAILPNNKESPFNVRKKALIALPAPVFLYPNANSDGGYLMFPLP
ncbi:hypothetical protein [Maribacter polysiphoniae]|uniref:hypothetical protein n=1 Tax=Maribacter polysiphoniae TaxID=429344 RepID=UPI000D6DBC9D|nr:hypothetical protein [Maribacter polysiphoniae]